MVDYDRAEGRESRPLLLFQHPIDEDEQEPHEEVYQSTDQGLPPDPGVFGRLFLFALHWFHPLSMILL